MKKLLVVISFLLVASLSLEAIPKRIFTGQSVAQPQQPTSYPLEIAPGAYSAYSVSRKLSSTYAGNAITIYRASDATEQEIGFTGDEVNSSAIAAFCAGTTGYVRRIYDQTGNGRNLSIANASFRPVIYENDAVVVGSNGKVACKFDGTDDNLTYYPATMPEIFSVHAVIRPITYSSGDVFIHHGSNVRGTLRVSSAPNKFLLNSGATLTGPSMTLGSWVFVSTAFNNNGNDSVSKNAEAATVGTAGGNTMTGIGLGYNTTQAGRFEFSEMITYSSDYSATNATILFTNSDTYYAIP